MTALLELGMYAHASKAAEATASTAFNCLAGGNVDNDLCYRNRDRDGRSGSQQRE